MPVVHGEFLQILPHKLVMPIKFACSQCKNVMTVDSKFAGKKGKCNKCGSVVEVPSESPANAASSGQPTRQTTPGQAGGPNAGQPRQVQPRPQQNPGQATSAQPGGGAAANAPGSPQSYNAAPPPSAAGIKGAGPLGHVFDELTESDYNRSSPYQNVYAPPKQSNDALNPMLIHAAKQELKSGGDVALGADGRPKLTVTIIVFAVLDILESLLIFGVTIALAVLGATLIDDEVKSKIPFLGAGIAIFIVILGFWATTLMASGLGLLTKQIWGYCTALFVYSFQLGLRIITAITAITDMEKVIGPIIGVLFMASVAGYLFQEECRRVYGISKKSKLPLIVGGVGLGLSLGIGGLLFLLGVFASAVAGDQPLPP